MKTTSLIRVWAFAAAAVAAIACGSVSNPKADAGGGDDAPGNTGDFTLSAAQPSLSIPIAGSATVTVTIQRMGDIGDVTLSAGGLGTNLTASFEPQVIPADATSAELTIAVVGGTQPATSTVTVTATAGDKVKTADISVTSTTITVTGRVRGNRVGVTVGMIGRASTTSGSGGVFTFTDVIPPYNLYTRANGGCGSSQIPTVNYFEGLTRTDPTVTAATYQNSCGLAILCTFPSPSASVSGSKTGGNNTDPVVWAFTGGSFSNAVVNTNSTYSGTASWCSGTNSPSGAIHALQLTRKTNGAPDTFVGYAKSSNVSFSNGNPSTVNLTFGAVNTVATLTGTLNAPAGYPTPSVRLNQQFGTSSRPLWEADTTALDAAFPILAPAGGNNLVAQSMLTGAGTSTVVLPLTASTTFNFTMPANPAHTAPADGAQVMQGTTQFSWTASDGVVTAAFISGGGVAYRIYSANKQFTFPIIPEQNLPAASSFTWSLTSYAPHTSVNDAADEVELLAADANLFTGPVRASASSGNRGFTTP